MWARPNALALCSLCLLFAATLLACEQAASSDRAATSPASARSSGVAPSLPATQGVPSAPAPVGSAPSPPRARTSIDADLAAATIYDTGKLPWRQIRKVNWRADLGTLAPLDPEPAIDRGTCGEGMVPIRGGYLLDREGHEDTDGVQLEQNAVCTRFRTEDKGINGLCDTFDRAKWIARTASFPRKQMAFCVDRYEFPNRYGEYPVIVATYAESAGYCEREGKRLCTESEWTMACEGEEAMPYPYGYERDPSACAMDRYGPVPDRDTFRPRMTAHTAKGLDLAFLASRAGELKRCTSPYGVSDLTGNVDEWTRTVRRYGYEMIMKGGHWGPARQRCRPQTRGHGPQYVRYDQGFRCCSAMP